MRDMKQYRRARRILNHEHYGSFREGDFVRWQIYPESCSRPRNSCGILSAVNGHSIIIKHFEHGFPLEEPTSVFGVSREGRDELLGHLSMIMEKFYDGIEEGGLQGARCSRKFHYLSGLFQNIENRGNPLSEPAEPGTGIYVVEGVYHYGENGRCRKLEGISVSPRLPEMEVSSRMRARYPEGFGRIKGMASRGLLVGYRAFEVPDEYRDLVENPEMIEL